jgi:hypothetical protein
MKTLGNELVIELRDEDQLQEIVKTKKLQLTIGTYSYIYAITMPEVNTV